MSTATHPIPRFLRSTFLALIIVCGGTWAFMVGWVAVAQAFRTDDLPDLLAIIQERAPLIFPLHMVTGGLTLFLIPLTLLARKRPVWHRTLGIVSVITVVVGGATSLVIAFVSVSPMVARIGFFTQGLLWIGLAVGGWVMIRNRRLNAHRRLMLMMAAVASGAMTLRLALAGFHMAFPWTDYRPFYSVIAWLGWALPLAAVIWMTRKTSATA